LAHSRYRPQALPEVVVLPLQAQLFLDIGDLFVEIPEGQFR
jgi:hypothetical protein